MQDRERHTGHRIGRRELRTLLAIRFVLWSGAFSEAMEDMGSDLSEMSPLERWLTLAVRIAELNLQHAESLIEPTTVTAWALSTCYVRIERADNRLRNARRL